MKTVYSFFCLLILLLISCNNTSTEVDGVVTIDCRSTNCNDSLDIQQFFSDASITLLEETEESRVGMPSKVIVTDSIIFVLDKMFAKKIFLFGRNSGKFLRSIGEIGNANGEYHAIWDCCIDEAERKVYALCNCEKIVTYDFDGTFISEHHTGLRGLFTLERSGDKFFLICTEHGKGNLMVLDKEFNILKQHFINEPDYATMILLNPIQIQPDGSITYFRYLDNNIYTLDENLDPRVLYYLDFGTDSISREVAKGMNDNECKDYIRKSRGDLKCLVENDKQAFLLYYDHRKPQLTVWDKENNVFHICPDSRVKDSKLGKQTYLIMYVAPHTFIATLDAKNVNPTLVTNKGVNGGNNPAIYWLHK